MMLSQKRGRGSRGTDPGDSAFGSRRQLREKPESELDRTWRQEVAMDFRDFELTPEERSFRDELRAWAAKEFPDGGPRPKLDTWEDRARAYRRWNRRLFDAGYAGVQIPTEYGGRGGTVIEDIIATEVLGPIAAVQGGGPEAVGHVGIVGTGIVMDLLLACGSEEQKKEFIPKYLNGSHIWCAGWSEPNNGSDLAGISTSGSRQGDHYVVNGQKIWTSFAHVADYCMLLVRTNRDAPKHKGLSFLLLDMKTPGIEVKPIKQMSEDSEFNEVFFENVKIPVDGLVGEEDGGWRIAVASLMFERVMGDLRAAKAYLLEFDLLLEMARGRKRGGRPVLQDPLFRQQVAQSYIKLMVLKYTGYRSASKVAKGEVPGPEGSIGKLLWSDAHETMGEVAMQIQGPYHQLMAGSPRAVEDGDWQMMFLRGRGNNIESGTSETMRNILGERVLGLPKDDARAAAMLKPRQGSGS
jgi:alkylation response protein AidB-like acyl-CoA dehydrogenase